MLGAKSAIDRVLSKLTPRERKLLELRYGLDTSSLPSPHQRSRMTAKQLKRADYHTLESVGMEFGINRERARQLISKAERRVRMMPEAKELKWFIYDK